MSMTLQEAIDLAINPKAEWTYGIEVWITISMHDDFFTVLVGNADGLDKLFRPDLPLLNFGTGAIGGGGGATSNVGWFSGPVPGFSTRGLRPTDGTDARLLSSRPTDPTFGTSIPIDFSVRRDPGIPWSNFLGMGPRIQIEIETLSGPAPGGTATSGIQLEAVQDGGLLRAVGPSLLDPVAKRASYTVTIQVGGRPG
jgi:hypothetical protein